MDKGRKVFYGNFSAMLIFFFSPFLCGVARVEFQIETALIIFRLFSPLSFVSVLEGQRLLLSFFLFSPCKTSISDQCYFFLLCALVPQFPCLSDKERNITHQAVL